eukprot:1264344-Pyramimonas_sp.AAC.1
MGMRPNNRRCPKTTATAAGQAAPRLKWTPSAATPTASPVQDDLKILSGLAPVRSVPVSIVPSVGHVGGGYWRGLRWRCGCHDKGHSNNPTI